MLRLEKGQSLKIFLQLILVSSDTTGNCKIIHGVDDEVDSHKNACMTKYYSWSVPGTIVYFLVPYSYSMLSARSHDGLFLKQ